MKIIAAISLDGAIGHDNEMIWNVKEDLQHFKNHTTNNVCVVGGVTYRNLPNAALKNREYIVLSNGENVARDASHKVVNNINELKKEVEKVTDKDVYIIGGSGIYEALLNLGEEAYITWINKMYPEANKRFPIERLFNDFKMIEDKGWTKDSNGISYKFTKYKRG